MTKEKQIIQYSPQGEAVLALATKSEKFAERYGAQLKKYATQAPSKRDFDKLLTALAQEETTIAAALSGVLQQTQGDKIGMFSQDDRTVFPELRVFHGSGNDTNRPEQCQVGNYYLNTKEVVGAEFVGTVIAIWKGRTMWGDRDAGESTNAPICQSMDRVVGSTCGECVLCPDLPWRDGKKTRCSDDVVAFMLTRDFKRLVVVRFAKTSTKAGHDLYRNIQIGSTPWAKWWKLTLDKQTKDQYKWYNIEVNPAGDEDALLYTPESIDSFCQALCINVSVSIILPGIARIYAQSVAETPVGGEQLSKVSAVSDDDFPPDTEEKDDESKYGDMPDEDTSGA